MDKTQNEKIAFALNTLRPNAEWTLSGSDYENIQWLDVQTQPTKAEVQAEIDNPTVVVMSIEQKLISVGLSVNDLKTALGLGGNNDKG